MTLPARRFDEDHPGRLHDESRDSGCRTWIPCRGSSGSRTSTREPMRFRRILRFAIVGTRAVPKISPAQHLLRESKGQQRRPAPPRVCHARPSILSGQAVCSSLLRDRSRLNVVETGITVERLAIGVRKGNTLRKAISKAQSELTADGTLAALIKQWLGSGATLPAKTASRSGKNCEGASGADRFAWRAPRRNRDEQRQPSHLALHQQVLELAGMAPRSALPSLSGAIGEGRGSFAPRCRAPWSARTAVDARFGPSPGERFRLVMFRRVNQPPSTRDSHPQAGAP